MGGNVGEFTTEINPGNYEPVIVRGGRYYHNLPAGDRWDIGSGYSLYGYGFRATLFLID